MSAKLSSLVNLFSTGHPLTRSISRPTSMPSSWMMAAPVAMKPAQVPGDTEVVHTAQPLSAGHCCKLSAAAPSTRAMPVPPEARACSQVVRQWQLGCTSSQQPPHTSRTMQLAVLSLQRVELLPNEPLPLHAHVDASDWGQSLVLHHLRDSSAGLWQKLLGTAWQGRHGAQQRLPGLPAGEPHVLMCPASRDTPTPGRVSHEAGGPALEYGSFPGRAAEMSRNGIEQVRRCPSPCGIEDGIVPPCLLANSPQPAGRRDTGCALP